MTYNAHSDTNVDQKSSIISIIGKPNVGKSTLLNNIIGQKISIITPKAQTTRNVINGITTIDNTQLIFFDTPGIFNAKRSVDKNIVRQAWSSIHNAQHVIVMIDCTEPISESVKNLLKQVSTQNINILIVINKIDTKKNYLVPILQYVIENNIKNIFQISALTSKGVDQLLKYLVNNSHQSKWIYDQNTITTLPMRFLITELTREQLFLKLKQELPYNLIIENEQWETFKNGDIKINQIIKVTTKSHKKIILGKNGSMIKEVGEKTRKEIKQIYGINVHLFLFVKIDSNMLDNHNIFSQIE